MKEKEKKLIKDEAKEFYKEKKEKKIVLDKKTKEEFLKEVKKVNPNADLQLISKAYDFAYKAHEKQKRKSGEPYFTHVLGTAYILLELKPGSSTIAAGLLHDVIEDTNIKPEKIKEEFGEEILELVEGVTKLTRIKRKEMKEAENLRKVILAMAKDIRVIMIKIADRLHNMRTLKYLSEEKQKKIAKQTLEIFVPIAYKLGMYRIKSELEDLCLRYLEPETYTYLKEKIKESREEREKNVEEAIKIIKEKLEEKNIKAKVYGRAKHFYSIINKMKKKQKKFEEIHDLLAIRIITEEVEDCYRILGIIHENFTPIPGRMDDYIANPKPNMYQSLHTEVVWKGKPLEIQIRTWDMHYTAEYGIASHWRYKGTEKDKKFDKRIEWLKQILEWKMNEKNAQKFLESFKIDLFKNEIVVFTPKGDPIILPEGSTPIDFAYEIHTDIGNHTIRAKVNDQIVPLDKELEPGDIVEIITQKNAKPSRSWLQIVKTAKARSKIRQKLGLHLDHDSKKYQIKEEETKIEEILQKIKYTGKRTLRYSKCCNPEYGDKIAGYIMKDGRIAVHKTNCINYQAYSEEKNKIKLEWKKEEEIIYNLKIETKDRIGMLAEILNIISYYAADVRNVRTKAGKESFFVYIDIQIEEKNIKKVEEEIKQIKDIIRIETKKKQKK